VFAYMRADNWLWNYRQTEGIQKSIRGLVRRSSFLSDSETANNLFIQHYNELQQCYDAFIPDVKQFTKDQLDLLNG
jgi:acyl carrier protein phosphodiesterase